MHHIHRLVAVMLAPPLRIGPGLHRRRVLEGIPHDSGPRPAVREGVQAFRRGVGYVYLRKGGRLPRRPPQLHLEAYVTRVRSRLTQPQAAFGEDVDREDSINPDGRISICLESEGFSEPDERARIDLLFGGALMCSSRTGPRL